jgi:hypothetical protein
MNGTSAHYSADHPLTNKEIAQSAHDAVYGVSSPDAAQAKVDADPDKVYRAHDTEREAARTKASAVDANADLAKAMKESLDRMDRTVADLAKVMSRRDAPAAAVSSPIPQSATQRKDFDDWLDQATVLKRLKCTTLPNGDRSFSLPTEGLRDMVAATVSDREAFIDRGPSLVGGASHLEITSSSDRAISYAMTYALAKWGNDPILIHVHASASDKHVARIVEHAVAQGLTVANSEPHIQAMVASARERQNNPLAREAHERDATIIERVSAGRER